MIVGFSLGWAQCNTLVCKKTNRHMLESVVQHDQKSRQNCGQEAHLLGSVIQLQLGIVFESLFDEITKPHERGLMMEKGVPMLTDGV